MATTSNLSPHSDQPRPSRVRNLWQLPMFVIGVAALVAVWQLRPYWHADPAHQYHRDLAVLRSILEQDRPDLNAASSVASRVVAGLEQFEERRSEAAFLLGSYYLFKAQSLGDDAPPEQWRLARDYLERVERHELTHESDRGKLRYRLGVAMFHTNADRDVVISLLNDSVVVADDPAEGYGLLALAYLRPPLVDVPNALKAVKQQLMRMRVLHGQDTRKLMQARLLCAELHLKLFERAEARKVLEQINDTIPELYVESRMRLARTYQEEDDHEQAARYFAQALRAAEKHGQSGEANLDLGTIRYHTALGYAKVGRYHDAIILWEKTRLSGGPQGQASALRLAELRMQDDGRASALALFESALAGVNRPEEWTNPLLPISEARGIVEEAAKIYKEGNDFAEAVQLARLYARIALPQQDRLMLADARESWGRSLLRQSPPAEDAARQQFLYAASEYLAVAANSRQDERKAELQKRAADCYLLARERQKAVELLTQTVSGVGLTDDLRSEMWFLIGETQLALGDKTAAREAYVNCLQRPGRYVAKARLQLGLLKFEAGDIRGGLEDLEKNLAPTYQVDREAFERSLFAIAEGRYQLQEYDRARDELTRAMQYFPDSPQVVAARFMLGRCSWYQAARESKLLQSREGQVLTPEARKSHEQRISQYLQQALDEFQKLATELTRKEARAHNLKLPGLTAEEAAYLRMSMFAAAECTYFLGEFEAAARRYEVLALKYQGQVEELVALSQLWQCYAKYLRQPEKAEAVVERISKAYEKLPASAFDHSSEIHQRTYWERWFAQLRQSQLPTQQQPSMQSQPAGATTRPSTGPRSGPTGPRSGPTDPRSGPTDPE